MCNLNVLQSVNSTDVARYRVERVGAGLNRIYLGRALLLLLVVKPKLRKGNVLGADAHVKSVWCGLELNSS